MKASILSKLERLQDRYEELEALLGVAEVIMDQDKFRAYSKEYAELEDVVNKLWAICPITRGHGRSPSYAG